MTMQPGSFAASRRAVLVERKTPAKATRSPDINSPPAAAKLGEADATARRKSHAAARARADPAVPGANGDSPVPSPRERRVEIGDWRNARRTSAVDRRASPGDDGAVLIESKSRPESIIAHSTARGDREATRRSRPGARAPGARKVMIFTTRKPPRN